MNDEESFMSFCPQVVTVKFIDERNGAFKFLDRQRIEHSAYVLANQVYINGKKCQPMISSPLQELATRFHQGEIVRAEVVKKYNTHSPASEWVVISIFIGSTEPPDHTSFVPNFHLVPHEQTVRYNEKVICIDSSELDRKFRLALGQLESGERVVVNKNALFDNGRPVKLRSDEVTEKFFETGNILNVDLARIPDFIYEKINYLRSFKYYTTAVWIGSKPDSSKLRNYVRTVHNTRLGNVILLCKDSSGIATSGVILPNRLENRPDTLSSNVRVYFERKDTYLYGASMENVNLALFFSNYSKVFVYFENDPVPNAAMQRLREFFGYDDKYVYVQAKVVAKGSVLPEELIFENYENRFHVNSANNDLKQYLRVQHKMSCDDLQFLVSPQRPSARIPPPVDKGPYRARMVTLKKPHPGTTTVDGYMEVAGGQYQSQWLSVNRAAIFIFGFSLKSANLMDLISPTDDFRVELEPQGGQGPFVKLAWIGQHPGSPPVDPDNVPEFKRWLVDHGILSKSEFFDCLSGKTPITPFFPLLPNELVIREAAEVHGIYRVPESNESFGLLKISHGAMQGELVPFSASDLYISNFCLAFCPNLFRVLKVGSNCFCEIRKSQSQEIAHWNSAFNQTCNREGAAFKVNPRYTAYLVYQGSTRPIQSPAKPAQRVIEEMKRDDFVCQFLIRQRLLADEFVSYVCGPASDITRQGSDSLTSGETRMTFSSHSRPAIENRITQPLHRDSFDARTSQDSYRSDYNSRSGQDIKPLRESEFQRALEPKPKEPIPRVSEPTIELKFIEKAQKITEKIMNCVSLTDPKIGQVILTDEDEELAIFLSRSLTAAIDVYKEKKNRIQKPLSPVRNHEHDRSQSPKLSKYLESLVGPSGRQAEAPSVERSTPRSSWPSRSVDRDLDMGRNFEPLQAISRNDFSESSHRTDTVSRFESQFSESRIPLEPVPPPPREERPLIIPRLDQPPPGFFPNQPSTPQKFEQAKIRPSFERSPNLDNNQSRQVQWRNESAESKPNFDPRLKFDPRPNFGNQTTIEGGRSFVEESRSSGPEEPARTVVMGDLRQKLLKSRGSQLPGNSYAEKRQSDMPTFHGNVKFPRF